VDAAGRFRIGAPRLFPCASNERFDKALTGRGIAHEFAEQAGGHDWGEWQRQLPSLYVAMNCHLR
jgi:enterochelin esterase-like enzyme